MLQEPSRWLDQLALHHVVENCAHSEESLWSHAEVSKAAIITQDLLNDKRGDRLREICPSFHDPQAEGNYFSLKKEVDNVWVVNFDESTDYAQRCQSEVLE